MVEIEAAAIARGVVPLPWTFLAAQMRATTFGTTNTIPLRESS